MSKELRGPLCLLLDDPIEHEALERVRRRVHASRRIGPARAWGLAPAAAVLLVVVAGGAVALSMRRGAAPDTGPLRLASGEPLRAARGGEGDTRVDLHEGSAIWLRAGTVLEAVENGSERVVLVQGDGRAVYDVHPGGPRRWSVDAGALTVDVVGTRFTIARDGAHVRVEVQRGRVRVRGAALDGGVRTLSAGDAVEVGAHPETPATELPQAPPIDTRPVSEAPSAARRERSDEHAFGRAGARWRSLAERGEYAQAFDLLGGSSGIALAAERARSVDELFALADTARLSGHAELAVDPLSRVVREHATDRRAAVAALTLGRLQLDALDAPAEACDSLERALTLDLPAHLREVALARLVEAQRRAGRAERARELAGEYLDRFPDGRNAGRIRAWYEAAEGTRGTPR